MEKEEIENMSTTEYILFVDAMTTKEFCDWQKVPHPRFTGDVDSSVNLLLQVDAIKHRLFVEKAKKNISKEKREKAMNWWNGLIMLDKARFSLIDRDFRTLTGREIELIYNQRKELEKNKNHGNRKIFKIRTEVYRHCW